MGRGEEAGPGGHRVVQDLGGTRHQEGPGCHQEKWNCRGQERKGGHHGFRRNLGTPGDLLLPWRGFLQGTVAGRLSKLKKLIFMLIDS